jgi:hypothetical protein
VNKTASFILNRLVSNRNPYSKPTDDVTALRRDFLRFPRASSGLLLAIVDAGGDHSDLFKPTTQELVVNADELRELQDRGRFYEMFPGAKAADAWRRARDRVDADARDDTTPRIQPSPPPVNSPCSQP